MKIVADSYAWIEVFSGSKLGNEAKQELERAEEVFTPDTVLSEIARKYVREGIEDSIIRERLASITEASSIVPINAGVALHSAHCFLELLKNARRARQGDPTLFDAIVLAFGRALKARVLTGDEHFIGRSETLWIGQRR